MNPILPSSVSHCVSGPGVRGSLLPSPHVLHASGPSSARRPLGVCARSVSRVVGGGVPKDVRMLSPTISGPECVRPSLLLDPKLPGLCPWPRADLLTRVRASHGAGQCSLRPLQGGDTKFWSLPDLPGLLIYMLHPDWASMPSSSPGTMTGGGTQAGPSPASLSLPRPHSLWELGVGGCQWMHLTAPPSQEKSQDLAPVRAPNLRGALKGQSHSLLC